MLIRTPFGTANRALLGLGVGVFCLAGGCGSEAPPERPNVLLITLDTTRRDRLGLYGYERPTSPHLDELASHATVFENAYSTSSWTLPAHASLFTGRYPTSHGMRHDPEGSLILADAIDAPEGIRARPLDAEARTLAEILGDAGYHTGAVVAGPWLIGSFGFARGFEHYDDERVAAGRRAADVTTSALRWLEEVREPFLLFLNYFDPHAPYAPPPAYRGSFLPRGVSINLRSTAQAPSLYDAEILYMDEQLGRLFRSLRERGLYDRTLIVVTADHGELLGDRGEWGHERYLWEPLLRVPLLLKPAGPLAPGRRDSRPVSVVDVLPRVLRATGLPPEPSIQGSADPDADRPILAEVSPMSGSSETGHWQALWHGGRKVLVSSHGEAYLFDLGDDPGETRNLADGDPELARRAEAELAQAFSELPRPRDTDTRVPIDPATLESLRELGYVK